MPSSGDILAVKQRNRNRFAVGGGSEQPSRYVVGAVVAAGDFLPLAQNTLPRREIIVPDFFRRGHRRIGEAQEVGRELVAAVDAERIGFLGECDHVLLAACEAPDHDARQAILALETYQPVLEHQEHQDIDARPMRNEIAPVGPTGRGERRPDDLEILGTVGIGADDQGRAAVEGGMVLDLVLDAGLARGNERRLGRGCGKIDQPRFRRLVIMGRDIAEASRRMAVD